MPQFIKFNKQTEESYWVTGVPRIINNPVFTAAMKKFGCTVSDIEDHVSDSPFISFLLAVSDEKIAEVKDWLNANASLLQTAHNPATQSENWDKMMFQVSNHPNQRIDGFPFSVPFPQAYGGQEYDIISVEGKMFRARVDDAREYMSEGLEWKTLGEDRDGNREKAHVAAWRKRSKD